MRAKTIIGEPAHDAPGDWEASTVFDGNGDPMSMVPRPHYERELLTLEGESYRVRASIAHRSDGTSEVASCIGMALVQIQIDEGRNINKLSIADDLVELARGSYEKHGVEWPF